MNEARRMEKKLTDEELEIASSPEEHPTPAQELALEKTDVDRLLETVLNAAMVMMNAERGAVFLIKQGKPEPIVEKGFPEGGKLSEVSTSALFRAISSGGPVISHDVQADPRYGASESVRRLHITSFACIPLYIRTQVVGAIYIDSRQDRYKFTEENTNFLQAFAHMASVAIDYADAYRQLYQDRLRLQTEAESRWRFEEIIGQSPKMQEVFSLMRRVLNSDVSILLEGESGTGKELVARALHYNGPRRDKPFVTQFCGNLPESLLESELFGHKKGAFTGAIADKKGLFEIADGGTFFLDEIADISPTTQAKLLRVLQDGEIRRVGDVEWRKVNVRIISATNKSLKAEVDMGRFREDLFYRLNVITIFLPPLRERQGDIPLLVNHFLKRIAERTGTPSKKVTPRAMQVLTNYHWPGNVRELENTIERAHILSEGPVIDVDDLLIPHAEELAIKKMTLKEFEKEFVLKVLRECNYNKTLTAETLGVSLRWLHYKLNEWKVPRSPHDT